MPVFQNTRSWCNGQDHYLGERDLFNNRKIAFIGPGVMAEAMIAGLIHENVADPSILQVSGPSSNRVKYLQDC